jgi:hypothetical protein
MTEEKLSVGFRVRVARIVEDWPGWVPPMNSCLGMEGIVSEATNRDHDPYYRVELIGKDSWNYPLSALEVIDRNGVLPGHGINNEHFAQELAL